MGRRFRPLDDAALTRLGDDALIDYLRRARTAGHPSAGTALAIMVFGHRANVERRVRMKVPPEHVEDLTADIVADAIVSAFDGSSVGAFHAWLNTITRRAIADFHRRGPGSVDVDPLPAERSAPAAEGVVEVHDAIDRVLARLRAEHRRVVEHHLLAGRPVAEPVVPGMSAANVHQIVRRFRLALRAELSAGGDTGSG
jgi:DNA-directed RNA polymerase specialized sigma24 family protein